MKCIIVHSVIGETTLTQHERYEKGIAVRLYEFELCQQYKIQFSSYHSRWLFAVFTVMIREHLTKQIDPLLIMVYVVLEDCKILSKTSMKTYLI